MTHPSNKQIILQLDSLSVGYGGKAVLAEVSFNLNSGRFLSLLGPNGAGKTTLLRTLAGLLPPLAGEIAVASKPLSKTSPAELARIQAVVLTDRLTPGLLTAYEVAALGRHPHTGFFGKLGPADHQAVEKAIAMVGAENLAGRFYERLSDGEKQKVVLARALAQEPRLILLDEPTVHLDLKHRLEVMSILRGLCREMNIAVVASLHDVDIAGRVSDEVALISSGGLAAYGPPETVLSDKAVARLYDLNGAHYDSRLGVIELNAAKRRGPVFVLPGGGAASAALRLLYKRDYSIMCGVAHQGDIDTHIANTLGAQVVSVPAFSPVGDEAMSQCREMMAQAEVVIDSGFTLGQSNQGNADLLGEAVLMEKPVFSLRDSSRNLMNIQGANGNIVYCVDEMELAARLSAYFHRHKDAASA